MKRINVENTVAVGSSVLTVIAPKFCCWSSALAAISGGTSYLAWVYPMRPGLFVLAFASLGYGFYKAYRPKNEVVNSCSNYMKGKPNFLQSKLWVWLVAAFVVTSFLINYLPQ